MHAIFGGRWTFVFIGQRAAKLEGRQMKQKEPPEREYDFTLVLTGITELTPEVENALFEAGCDDATLSRRFGRQYLTFSRNAPTLKEAILSAIHDVRRSEVLRVDSCDLVNQSEIARRIGRSRQLVHQYLSGERGPGGFPPPVCHISDDAPLWMWCEVAYWLWQNDMMKEEALREARLVAVINDLLDLQHQKHLDPQLIEEIWQLMAG
jgi:hypothetical protein